MRRSARTTVPSSKVLSNMEAADECEEDDEVRVKPNPQCSHGKKRSQCDDLQCGGCVHGKLTANFRPSAPYAAAAVCVCLHGKQRSQCNDLQ